MLHYALEFDCIFLGMGALWFCLLLFCFRFEFVLRYCLVVVAKMVLDCVEGF